MAPWLILAVGVVYLWIAIDLARTPKKLGLALAFAGYAVANVGLWLAALDSD